MQAVSLADPPFLLPLATLVQLCPSTLHFICESPPALQVTNSFSQTFEVAGITPILQLGKQRHRNVMRRAHGHAASEQQLKIGS